VLFLAENHDGSFVTTAGELSMFRINEDGTVYSFDDDEITAQFDGKPLAVLEDEIAKAITAE